MGEKRIRQSRSEGKAAAVFLVSLPEFGGLLFLKGVYIGMGTERIPGKLDHRDGDVGAVIRDALAVRDDVVEYKALLDCADPLLKPLYVVELHLVAEFIHYLFQSLDTAG
jgi:hypothetical protein